MTQASSLDAHQPLKTMSTPVSTPSEINDCPLYRVHQ